MSGRGHTVRTHNKWGYGNGCRCDVCRAAFRDHMREWSHKTGRHRPWAIVVAERRAEAEARDNHGTETRYHLGCRCDECRRASADARRRRRHASRPLGEAAQARRT